MTNSTMYYYTKVMRGKYDVTTDQADCYLKRSEMLIKKFELNF